MNINKIIEYLGGAENIIYVTNCMTRLRITLKSDDDISEDKLKALEDVLGIVLSGKNKHFRKMIFLYVTLKIIQGL